MPIYNLGSINADSIYNISNLPKPGETVSAYAFEKGMGGKGANMSVAAARAGAKCLHIGAVGPDGRWAVERLMEYGVDTRHVNVASEPTGQAMITVDDDGENSIVIYPGANRTLNEWDIGNGLKDATSADIFLMQNETNGQKVGAKIASMKGMRVAYAAAPFDVEQVQELLPLIDLLIMNEVEADQLRQALGQDLMDLGVRDVVVTLGAQGCLWVNTDEGTQSELPAFPVTPVDTTGAGDTFTGYLLSGLDMGIPMELALKLALKAAALMVTRIGTADVIPDLKEVREFS